MHTITRKRIVSARIAVLVLAVLLGELFVPLGVALAQQTLCRDPAWPTGPLIPCAPVVPTPSQPLGPTAPLPSAVQPAPAPVMPPGVIAPTTPAPSAIVPPITTGQPPSGYAPRPQVTWPGASGYPATLTPLAPPVTGTAGQPLPPGTPTTDGSRPQIRRPGEPLAPGPMQPGATLSAPSEPLPPTMAPSLLPELPPSAIERAFAELRTPLTVDRQLRQFGYALFEAPPTTFAPVDNVPVGSDYVVGPGDTLYVNMWGLAEASFQVTVDRNGEILLPKAGPLRVWGQKFADVEKAIRDQLSQYYQRVNVAVTMGPLRTMKVFILGDVAKPGTYTLSSLATMTNALFAAGGPSKQGSLREVRLIRNNRIIARMDLYKFLLEGSREGDERLLPDDTVFVPPIGPVAALAGYVKRPAIYELKGPTTLAQLLELGGGLTVLSYIKRVQVERVVDRQRKVALDAEFLGVQDFEAKATTYTLQEGDFVSIFPIDTALYRLVVLEGNVRRPGTYALKPGMRVKDLLAEGEGLLPGAYMARADLAKYRDGRQYEMVALNLTELIGGAATANPLLDEFDRVIVYHQLDVQPAPMVQVTGAVYRPGVFEMTPNMRVSDLLFRGSPTRQASLRNAELFRDDPGRMVRVIQLDLARIVANPGGAEDLLLADQDHLYIRQLAEGVEKRTVTISGRVRFPGEYAIAPEERLSSLIERAGGLLPDAFSKGAVFIRQSIRDIEQQQLERFIRAQEQSLIAESAAITSGAADLSQDKAQVAQAQATVTAQRRELLRSLVSAVTLGRLAIRLDAPEKLRGTPDDIRLENGDSLQVPQIPTSVAILGAVRSGTAILHEPNQGVEYYLAQAGGATREADTDGIYILKPNGVALASFNKIRAVEAGDAIIVPISTEPKIRTLPLLRDIATILTGFALPFATIVALVK